MSEKIVTLTDETFEEDVLKSDDLVLVDFWAEWCGPCKMIAPILSDAAQEYDGKVVIGKLDIDKQPATAPKYGVRGIPTLVLFKHGTPIDTIVGAQSKSSLKAFLDKHV